MGNKGFVYMSMWWGSKVWLWEGVRRGWSEVIVEWGSDGDDDEDEKVMVGFVVVVVVVECCSSVIFGFVILILIV